MRGGALGAGAKQKKWFIFMIFTLRIASLQVSGSARGLPGSSPSLLKKESCSGSTRGVVVKNSQTIQSMNDFNEWTWINRSFYFDFSILPFKDLPTNDWYRSLIGICRPTSGTARWYGSADQRVVPLADHSNWVASFVNRQTLVSQI